MAKSNKYILIILLKDIHGKQQVRPYNLLKCIKEITKHVTEVRFALKKLSGCRILFNKNIVIVEKVIFSG